MVIVAEKTEEESQMSSSMEEDDASSVSVLAGFKLLRVLDQDAKTRSAVLLGTFPALISSGDHGTVRADRDGVGQEEVVDVEVEVEVESAIILLEKTHFEPTFFSQLGQMASTSTRSSSTSNSPRLQHLSKVIRLGQNDVYNWLMAWRVEMGGQDDGYAGEIPADMKINVIRPATDAHISKYERQEKRMVRETPDMYQTLVKPWVEAQPASRINWVYNILQGKKETENVLYKDDDPNTGFVILPDLKWDRRTLSSLYLICLVQDRSLRSLRNLQAHHIPLLRNIQATAAKVAFDFFGLGKTLKEAHDKVRCFIHYQPSYYHLHIHILSVEYTSHQGAIVGQAHLLDDVIDLLQAGVDFEKRTLTYALGERHELVQILAAAAAATAADADGA